MTSGQESTEWAQTSLEHETVQNTERLTAVIWTTYTCLLRLTRSLRIAAVVGTCRLTAAVAEPSQVTLARPVC